MTHSSQQIGYPTPEHERYDWLRNGKSVNGGWGGTAPYVMSPTYSQLYAVMKLRGEILDVQIDADILHSKAHELHINNELVERKLIPVDANGHTVPCTSDEYYQALYKLAQQELGWSIDRFKKAVEFK